MSYLKDTELKIDNMTITDKYCIKNTFMSVDTEINSFDDFFEKATENMSSTDNQELERLFEAGIKLGAYLKDNEIIIKENNEVKIVNRLDINEDVLNMTEILNDQQHEEACVAFHMLRYVIIKEPSKIPVRKRLLDMIQKYEEKYHSLPF